MSEENVVQIRKQEPCQCGEKAMARLMAMPEFQAGARSVRNQSIVDEARDAGRGQRRELSGISNIGILWIVG